MVVGGGDGHGGLVECPDQHRRQRSHRLRNKLARADGLGEQLLGHTQAVPLGDLAQAGPGQHSRRVQQDQLPHLGIARNLEDGERLAATIPNARLEVIERARTFSMLDRPDRLADLLSIAATRT